MLEFTCPSCGKSVQYDESSAGKPLLCPFCHAALNAVATPEHAPQAKITPPNLDDGSFQAGEPPLREGRYDDRPLPPIRRELPGIFMGWLPILIVILIVVVLIALLMPATRRVQSASARTQSTNNIKQIVLAFQGFHDANKQLPYNGTSAVYAIKDDNQEKIKVGGPAIAGDKNTGSWAFMILPYIDQTNMFLRVDASAGIAAYMCPGRGRPTLCTGAGGPGAWTDYFLNPFLNDPKGAFDVPDAKLTMKEITDGTSNTIFVGHGTIDPADYISTFVVAGVDDIIFKGGSPGLIRNGTKGINGPIINQRDAKNQGGTWGGPFPQSLMGMGDGTVHMVPYSCTGGNIDNGVAAGAEPNAFGAFLTPKGGEIATLPDT